MVPPAPTFTIARLGVSVPGSVFTFDASGRVAPVGHAVTNASASAWVLVMLSTTAPTPVSGTPPRPVTSSVIVCAGPSRPSGAPLPSRVSSTREGVSGW